MHLKCPSSPRPYQPVEIKKLLKTVRGGHQRDVAVSSTHCSNSRRSLCAKDSKLPSISSFLSNIRELPVTKRLHKIQKMPFAPAAHCFGVPTPINSRISCDKL